MRSIRLVCVLGSLALAAACGDGGGDDDSTVGADANPNAPDANPNVPDADPNAPDADTSFTTLISRSWTIPPGDEFYRCTAVTIEQDMWIAGFGQLAPVGTHHTVLSVSETPTRSDGDFNCGAGDLEHAMLFASGVGTDDLIFPDGVAMKVNAGSQLHLNLHLYNVSDQEISGTSGTLGKVVSADDVQEEAEVVFGGTTAISIPPTGAEHEEVGGCQFTQDATVLTLWPHMHQLGRHMTIVHETSGGDVTLLDEPFDFNEQVNYGLSPTVVKAGERLRITCTYINDTEFTVDFGDSSDKEMCFAGVYRYPATGAGLFSCTEFL